VFFESLGEARIIWFLTCIVLFYGVTELGIVSVLCKAIDPNFGLRCIYLIASLIRRRNKIRSGFG
jgi:hypothetical protein